MYNMLLDPQQSQALSIDMAELASLQISFAMVAGTGAKFGMDGDQYYYGVGDLPEATGIYGFGKTPREALAKFSSAYYSQTIKTKNDAVDNAQQ